jgi:gentisate 1,2-dioxygenase
VVQINDVSNVNELDEWLKERHLGGHWQGAMTVREEFKPHVWRWEDIYAGLMKSTEVVAMEDTGRRTIQLKVPSLGNRMSNTIHMSIQCVMPGEVATAHRHNAAAVRFVISAEPGAFTVVDGEPFPMLPGDFITTPSNTYHDHYNESNAPVMWLDGLDIRLAQMGKLLGNEYEKEQQNRDRPVGFSAKTLGHAKPSFMKSPHLTPPFRYPWEETEATFNTLKETEQDGDPHNGYLLTYTHPVTQGPTLPTFACEIQLLLPQQKTKDHRHISTTIYQVFRGKGATIVEGERLEWNQGDIFVVPPWAWHHHENLQSEDTILYSMNDWPALKSLGLYQEESRG